MTPYDAEEIAERSLERDETGDVRTYVCSACGQPLEDRGKHPVTTRSDSDPTVLLFCREGCRQAWPDRESETE